MKTLKDAECVMAIDVRPDVFFCSQLLGRPENDPTFIGSLFMSCSLRVTLTTTISDGGKMGIERHRDWFSIYLSHIKYTDTPLMQPPLGNKYTECIRRVAAGEG